MISIGALVASHYGDERILLGMIMGQQYLSDVWVVEWYDVGEQFQITYNTESLRGLLKNYNRLRSELWKTQ